MSPLLGQKVAPGAAIERVEAQGPGQCALSHKLHWNQQPSQDLGDIMPQLLAIKAQANVPLRFHVEITLGDGKRLPPADVVQKINALLEDLKAGFRLQEAR